MFNLRELENWTAKEPVSARKLQQPINALRSMIEAHAFRIPGEPDFILREMWPGIITSSSFTNEQYKVRRCYIQGGLTEDAVVLNDDLMGLAADDNSTQDVRTVTNLLEVREHSHDLAVDQDVIVFVFYDRGQTNRKRYVMSESPEGMRSPVETLTGTGTTVNSVTWSRDSDTEVPDVSVVTRVVWDTTAGIIYQFARTLSFDSIGTIYAVSAETRTNIETAVACS